MTKTTDEVTPTNFLLSLRQAFPQFAEMSRGQGGMKGGYAQQGKLHDCSRCSLEFTHLVTIYRCGGVLGTDDQRSAGRTGFAWSVIGVKYAHEHFRGAIHDG